MTQQALTTITRMNQAAKMLGLSKATIYGKLNPNDRRHDASFPRMVRLGANAVGFVTAELEDWIASRIAARDGAEG